jgi:5-methylcytosine-specific restriction protein A
MSESPDSYHLPESDRTGTYSASQGQEGGDGFYQGYPWKKFRARMKRRQRLIDENRLYEIYSMIKEKSYTDYRAWLQADSPLCIACVEEDKIKPASICDHITPRKDGGETWALKNLQWLCDYHHNQKRATKDKLNHES